MGVNGYLGLFSVSLMASILLLACGDSTIDSPDAGTGTSDVIGLDSPDTGGACVAPALPVGDGDLVLVAAGAPIQMFGPENAPTFEAAFDELSTVGFNGFFPWFGTQEVAGVATVSGHFEYWVPLGFSATPRNCGVINPYLAAEGRLGVLFPAFLFSDAVGSAAFNPEEFRNRYADFRTNCWGDDESVILGYQSFDELGTLWALNDFLGRPTPRLQNAPEAAALLHELGDAPVYLVEGPLPLTVEREGGLTVEQRASVLEKFWASVDTTIPGADVFGFDVYPIPDRPPSVSAEYIAFADERAPGTERLAVLQGFSYNAETGRMDPRRGPTQLESRFMAFDAIASGVTHLVWYGASALEPDTNDEDRIVWEGVTHTVGLVSQLNSAFSREVVPIGASDGIAAFGRRLDEGTLVVLLNRTPTPATATLTLPGGEGDVFDWETGAEVSPTAGISVEPFEVRILLSRACAQ